MKGAFHVANIFIWPLAKSVLYFQSYNGLYHQGASTNGKALYAHINNTSLLIFDSQNAIYNAKI